VDHRNGGYAKTSDPDTWTTFDRVRDYHADLETDTDGLGFVFTSSDTVAGVDFDHCRDPETGRPDETVKDVIRSLDSHTEVSPSGTDHHVYVHGFVPDGGNRRDGVEMYDDDPAGRPDDARGRRQRRAYERADNDRDGGDDAENGGLNVTLCPAGVAAWGGLGEDEDMSDLSDRQKAACVWELIKHSDRYHVCVRRDKNFFGFHVVSVVVAVERFQRGLILTDGPFRAPVVPAHHVRH
jgi:hypothetical protein